MTERKRERERGGKSESEKRERERGRECFGRSPTDQCIDPFLRTDARLPPTTRGPLEHPHYQISFLEVSIF